MLGASVGHADGGSLLAPSGSSGRAVENRCLPMHPLFPVTRFNYTGQMPVLIRDERTMEDFWSYADTCTRTPMLTGTEGWSILTIGLPDGPVWEWEKEKNYRKVDGRSKAMVDRFPPNLRLLMPDGSSDKLLDTAMPTSIRVGLGKSDKAVQLLREAGYRFEPGQHDDRTDGLVERTWVRQPGPAKALVAWYGGKPGAGGSGEPLLSFTKREAGRYDYDPLAPVYDHRRPSAPPIGDVRTLIRLNRAAIYLFPNVTLANVRQTGCANGLMTIEGEIVNRSASSGRKATLLYSWTGADGSWQPVISETLEPYQNARSPQAPGTLLGPQQSFKVQIPSGDTKLWLKVEIEPGSDLALAEDPTDNLTAIATTPCCDLSVAVYTAAETTATEYQVTVVATRIGCNTLTDVELSLTARGETWTQPATFGKTAQARFQVDRWGGGCEAVTFTAMVDPHNRVQEQNEGNNTATATARGCDPNSDPGGTVLGMVRPYAPPLSRKVYAT